MNSESSTKHLDKLLETASREPTNIFSLLNKYRVIVPGIQRHYVQGEDTVKAREVRETFIRDIFECILHSEPMSLNFIYGPIDTVGMDAFVPVDGQQRLTTLWLLARYFTDHLSDHEARKTVLKLLGRFTYEDRIHATRFCHALTSADEHFFKEDKRPSNSIKQCEWFNPYWVSDCTVENMLNTLDTIDVIKKEEYLKLEAQACLDFMISGITFHLCTEQFADDIYMKMNARGLTLTQWENFKGRFSELLTDKKLNWDKQIEVLSDAYYDRVEFLPDNALFAFMARILVFEAKIQEKDFDWGLVPNILKLAKHVDWAKELPYVPFKEFKELLGQLKVTPATIAKSFLATIAYSAKEGNADLITPYWHAERTLIQCLCQPANKNELDLSLCLYLYFKKFQDSNPIEVNRANFVLALRLIWNVLENVSVGDKDNPYNRVTGIQQIIQNGCQSLYSDEIANSGPASLQYKEEAVKAAVYRDGENKNVSLMQAVEKHMHGRIRLGVLNLEDDKPHFSLERLNVLRNIFKQYLSDEEGSSARKTIILKIIAAEPYSLNDAITLSTGNDNLRMLLSTRDDKSLQSSLIDEEKSASIDDPQSWKRDWRETILKLAELGNIDIWNRTIRRHRWGVYYLYSGSTIRGAIPINDYRIELMFPENAKKYKELGGDFKDIEMNDADTHSGEYKLGVNANSSPHIYFYHNHAEVRIWIPEADRYAVSLPRTYFDDNNIKSVDKLLEDVEQRLTQNSHKLEGI